MSEESKHAIKLYYLPQTFPCGPKSRCCGPVGQSQEELENYVSQLEKSLPELKVQTIDVSQKLSLQRDEAAVKLLNAFGGMACPIFAIDGEVISMGPPSIPELVQMIKTKFAGTNG